MHCVWEGLWEAEEKIVRGSVAATLLRSEPDEAKRTREIAAV